MPPTNRPYRDFLTPSLHRRFTTAALVTLGICYLEAVWMGQWDLFWQWFPLGLAGVRTALIFIAVLAVFILRIAQLHIGSRTSSSPFSTFLHVISSSGLSVIQTVLWYSFSAWLFGEVYIWSASSGAKLSMVDSGKSYERSRLNERPIYLRAMFLCLGFAQAIFHLYKDYDRVRFDVPRVLDPEVQQRPQTIMISLVEIKQKITPVAAAVPIRLAVVAIISTLLYLSVLRHTAWKWTFFFARALHQLPKASRPSTLPSQVADLLGRFLVQGTLLMFLWDFANLAFDVFVGQAPMKKGAPLSEGSSDPNHTLLAGLKAKKEVTRNFAFWELVIIASTLPARRLNIYQDINRAGGSAWSQIVPVCLGELHAVSKRIQDSRNSTPSPAPTQQTNGNVQSLPKITQGTKQGNIFAAAPPPPSRLAALEDSVGALVKSQGLSPGASIPIPSIPPQARKLIAYGEKLVPQQAQDKLSQAQSQLSPDSAKTQIKQLAVAFVRSPLGLPFRQSFARNGNAIITDSRYSALSPIVDSIVALTRFATASLKEDPYGLVHADVPNIVRTFTSTCISIESFLQNSPVHWTDVDFREESGRKVQDVEFVIKALRDGLKELVNEFGEYADDLGLSRAELRAAKEVVARGASGESNAKE